MADLRSKGILKKWLDDKGYGFITFDKGKQKIFVHISAFGEGLARRPRVGDTVYFLVHSDKDGKRKAVDAIIQGVGTAREISRISRGKPNAVRKSRSSKLMFLPMLVVLGVMVGFVVYYKYFDGAALPGIHPSAESTSSSAQFTCRGKTRCPQMTSCDEATFYLQNCPGTEIDEDGDGIPCETQWCNAERSK